MGWEGGMFWDMAGEEWKGEELEGEGVREGEEWGQDGVGTNNY